VNGRISDTSATISFGLNDNLILRLLDMDPSGQTGMMILFDDYPRCPSKASIAIEK